MKKILLFSFLIFFACFFWRLAGVAYFLSTGSGALAVTAADEGARQPLMLAFLGALTLGMTLYFKFDGGQERGGAAAFAAVALYFGYLSFQLLLFQERLLGPPARLWYNGLLWAGLLLGLYILRTAIRGYGPAWSLALAGYLGYAAIQSLSLALPLGQQSDMLPLIQASGLRFLSGHSPYSGFEGAPANWVCTYWPGMWLSYLPFSALGLDLRLGNLVFMALFACLAYGAAQRRETGVSALLALFLLNPWLGYRHELYISAYLWSLALFAYALAWEKRMLAALAFGWSLALYPFSWCLLPAWVAWEQRRAGRPAALKSAGLALGVAALFIAPFLAADPAGFWKGVAGHWVGNVEASHYNLIHWIPSALLVPIQAGGCLVATWMAWKGSPSRRELFKAGAVGVGVFVTANAHGSHYFFFIVAALLYFYSAASPDKNGALKA